MTIEYSKLLEILKKYEIEDLVLPYREDKDSSSRFIKLAELFKRESNILDEELKVVHENILHGNYQITDEKHKKMLENVLSAIRECITVQDLSREMEKDTQQKLQFMANKFINKAVAPKIESTSNVSEKDIDARVKAMTANVSSIITPSQKTV